LNNSLRILGCLSTSSICDKHAVLARCARLRSMLSTLDELHFLFIPDTRPITAQRIAVSRIGLRPSPCAAFILRVATAAPHLALRVWTKKSCIRSSLSGERSPKSRFTNRSSGMPRSFDCTNQDGVIHGRMAASTSKSELLQQLRRYGKAHRHHQPPSADAFVQGAPHIRRRCTGTRLSGCRPVDREPALVVCPSEQTS
jgi:hypothetical protein